MGVGETGVGETGVDEMGIHHLIVCQSFHAILLVLSCYGSYSNLKVHFPPISLSHNEENMFF